MEGFKADTLSSPATHPAAQTANLCHTDLLIQLGGYKDITLPGELPKPQNQELGSQDQSHQYDSTT